MFKFGDAEKFVASLEDDSRDVVKEFIKNGGYLHSFIRLLEPDEVTDKVQNLAVVFSAITPFITRSQTDLPEVEDSVLEISDKLISNHLKLIEKLLTNDKKYSIIALQLLTGIVNLDYDMAKEILLELQIPPDTMDNLTSNQKTRAYFMDFMLSFVAKNSSSLFSLLINKSKNMLNSITPGLVVDRVDQILKFFSTLETFLKTVSLADNVKHNAFQPTVLSNLAELYKWQGPENFKKFFKPVKPAKKQKVEHAKPIDDSEKEFVRKEAHKFLTLLCTSEEYGIISTDLTLKNIVDQTNGFLINLLKSKLVVDMWTDNLQAELLTEILKASPNLIEPAFSNVAIQSSNLFTLFMILTEVVQHSKCFGNNLLVENYCEISVKLCIPRCVGPHVKNAIQNSDGSIRYSCIRYLVTCLKKLNKYIIIYFNRFSSNKMNNYVSNYFQKNVVTSQLLHSAWTVEKELKFSYISEKGETISEEMYLSSLAEVLTLCCDLSSTFADSICQHFADISFDACLFFSAAPFLKVFSLLIYLNKIDPSQIEFRIGLQKVIVVMVTEKNNEAKELFYKLLTNSRLFEGTEDELITWVHCFLLVNPNHAEKLAELFSSAVEFLMSKPSLFNIFDDLTNEPFKPESDVLNLDKIAHSDSAHVTLLSAPQLYISPLIPALMQNFASDNRKVNNAVLNSIKKFYSLLIVHTLHSQPNVESFILSMISRPSTYSLIKDAFEYVNSWRLKKKGASILTCKEFTEESLEYTLTKIFESHDGAQLKQNQDIIKQASPEHLVLLVRYSTFTASQLILRGKFSSIISKNISSVILFILRFLPENLKLSCMKFILTHPSLLEAFSITDLTNQETNSVSLISSIISSSELTHEEHLQDYLIPYRARFMMQLKEEIKKTSELSGNKKFISDLAVCLKLKDTEAIEVVEQIFVSCKRLSETWSYIVAHMLEIISENKLNETLPAHLVSLLSSHLPNKRLQRAIISYFNSFPHSIEFVHPGFLRKLLNLKETNALGILLMSLNPSFMETFIDMWDSIKDCPKIIFAVLTAVSGNSDVSDEILRQVVQVHLSDLSKLMYSSPDWFKDNNLIISQLVYRFVECDKAAEECKKIEEMWLELEAEPRVISVLEAAFNKAGFTLKLTELLLIWTGQLLMSHKYDQVEGLLETVSDCCLVDCSGSNYHSLSELSVWSQFSKLALKYGLGEENLALLNCLAVVSNSIFSKESSRGAQELFDMTVSHSSFIQVVLSKSNIRVPLFKLLLTIIKADPAVMKPSHIPLFLGAYSASLSRVDQLILQILCAYEENGVKLNKYQPYIWGETAINHFSVRSKHVSLHKQPHPVKFLDLLVPSRIDATIERFPVDRMHKTSELLEPDDEVYDPAFLVPVLNCIVATESTVRWHQLTRSRAISILFASLSLSDSVLRSTAYLALSKFHQHLQTGEKSRALWIQLVDIVRNGIIDSGLNQTDATPQLPSIITIFLARASLILIEPSNPMFRPLVSFITINPFLRLNQVPEFLILFFSTKENHRIHRTWLLRVIKDGMKRIEDWKLSQSSIFKIILSFYSSSLATDDLQEHVLDVMESTVRIPAAAMFLATSYGFISWLSHVIFTLRSSSLKPVPKLAELLQDLGSSLPNRYASTLLNLSLSIIQHVSLLNQDQLLNFVMSLRFISRKARQPIPSSLLLSLLNNMKTNISIETYQKCQYFLKHGTKYSPSVNLETNSKNLDQHLLALFLDYL